MTTLIQIKQGIGMDKDRQNRLLVTAAKHYDYEYSTSEARAGLQLTSMLLGLPLTTEASGDWFDASLLGDKKIATRIWRDFDTGSDIEQRKFFKIEVGITSPEGTMQQDDPNF